MHALGPDVSHVGLGGTELGDFARESTKEDETVDASGIDKARDQLIEKTIQIVAEPGVRRGHEDHAVYEIRFFTVLYKLTVRIVIDEAAANGCSLNHDLFPRG